MRAPSGESSDRVQREDAAEGEGAQCPGGPAPSPLSDVEFLRQVGRGVASVYSDILGQPMPDRLVALLKRLEEEEDAPKPKGGRSHL